MENYRQMWMSLRNDLSMRIREYRQADNIAGLDDYGLTELDAWEGIMQEIEGLERELEENNQSKEDKNNMQNMKRKAEAFDEMVKIYNQKNDLPSDEIYMEMGYCISDLECGSDEEI